MNQPERSESAELQEFLAKMGPWGNLRVWRPWLVLNIALVSGGFMVIFAGGHYLAGVILSVSLLVGAAIASRQTRTPIPSEIWPTGTRIVVGTALGAVLALLELWLFSGVTAVMVLRSVAAIPVVALVLWLVGGRRQLLRQFAHRQD